MYIPTNQYYNLPTVDILTCNFMYNNVLFSFLSHIQLKSQFPTRPIVLIGFSLAGRIAAKVSIL